MASVLEELLEKTPVLTDGAWGTQLQALGLPVGEAPDLWNLSHPESVEEVARSYVEAGSRVILTNTLGSNRVALKRHEMDGRTAEINREGARISRRAAGDAVKVFASVGSTSKMLMMGEISPEEVHDVYVEQTTALAEGGVDGFVIETMTDLEEAKIAVRAAKLTGLPVVACMVFDAGKNLDRTMMGATPEQAVRDLVDAGADVVGSNCGKGAAEMIPICERMRAVASVPLWMKPNAGLPELIDGRTVFKTPPEVFVANAVSLAGAGASFIGGCCGTDPVMIRALSAALR